MPEDSYDHRHRITTLEEWREKMDSLNADKEVRLRLLEKGVEDMGKFRDQVHADFRDFERSIDAKLQKSSDENHRKTKTRLTIVGVAVTAAGLASNAALQLWIFQAG